MKAKLISIVAGLAFAATAPGAATAGGDYYGGAVSGTAVPAPIPLPVYDPVWYMRVDAGVAFGSMPDITETGAVFGDGRQEYSADQTFGSSVYAQDNNFDYEGTLGLGVGYRFSDRVRMDVTGEYVRGLTSVTSGTHTAGLHINGVLNPGGVLSTDYEDSTEVAVGAFLVNAYYDMGRWAGFTPYVGAGVGFAISQVDRRASAEETAYENVGGNYTRRRLYNSAQASTETEHSLAAMASVGASYQLSDVTELDLNYRYMFVGGVNSELEIHGHRSVVEIDDFHDHQLRAGLRFNVN
jgi:opacity protein-like surface antigen